MTMPTSFKHGLRSVLLLWALTFAATPACAQSAIEELRDLWRMQNYAEAFAGLSAYRKEPYGKTFEVYYMAGTSLCRLPGQQDLGVKYLQWILDNYRLEPMARGTVETEKGICSRTSLLQPVLITFNTTVATAGVSGSTKVFYFVGGDNALRSVPVEVIREVPLAELQQRLFSPQQREEAVVQAKMRAGESAQAQSNEHFVVVSLAGHSAAAMQQMATGLDETFEFFVDGFGMRAPEHLVTVYLVASFEALQNLSRSLHGIAVAPQSLGYSYRDDLSMVGYAPTAAIGTLKHELFHLMVRNDFGDIPPWLDEGMAALYEVSISTENRIVGLPNWRGRVLREFWSEAPTVEELLRMNWLSFSGAEDDYRAEQQAANHAKARYLALYLQERGWLKAVYQAFQGREIGADSVQTFETALRQEVGNVERDFEQWFRSLPVQDPP